MDLGGEEAEFFLWDLVFLFLIERRGDLDLELVEDCRSWMMVSSFSPFARCVFISVRWMFFRTFTSCEGRSDGGKEAGEI